MEHAFHLDMGQGPVRRILNPGTKPNSLRPDGKQLRHAPPGDPAPRFQAATESNPRYIFDTVAGRYVVLCFHVSGATPGGAAALAAVAARRHVFDDERACFFGVSVDPSDRDTGRVRQDLPGIRHFWDFDGHVSRTYGALPRDAVAGTQVEVRQFWSCSIRP